MPIEYRRFTAAEARQLADFLTEETWPYHGRAASDPGAVHRQIADGHYDGDSTHTFWILADQERIGLIRLWDLTDDTPMFDLRIRAAHRRRGIGTQALAWLTRYTLTGFPAVVRIEGTTRQDNHGMRQVFRRCGYAKEAHYRDAWPGPDGAVYDAVGYAILRRDWLSGTTTPVDWDDEANRDERL
jgi:RimJ/RimL family protein N-acetyltransferase